MEDKKDSFADIVAKYKRGVLTYNYQPEYVDDLPEGPRMIPGIGMGSAVSGEFIVREFVPRVDRDRCNKCGICWVFCPLGLFSEDEEGLFVVNVEYCRPCGICANECPVKAIEMVRVAK